MKTPISTSPPEQHFIRTRAAAHYLSIGKSTLDKYRLTGEGPRFSKLGRSVVYALADLDSWAASRAVSSTSEADARLRR